MKADPELLAIASLLGLAMAASGMAQHDLIMTLAGAGGFALIFHCAEKLREQELEDRDGDDSADDR